MRTTALVSATLIALANPAHAGEGAHITLYSGDYDALASSQASYGPQPGFALVREPLQAELVRGDNAVSRSDLPASIDSAAVRLQPARDGVRVSGQRYDFAVADQDELLRRAIGQRITVEQVTGSTVARYAGTLLAAGNGLTLADDDGAVRVLANYASFQLPALPGGLAPRPTLRWNVASERAGAETFQLDYATGGMAWRAEYLATLDAGTGACRMAFDGAAQIVNRSGANYPAATLRLVAGAPNVQREAMQPRPQMMRSAMMDMAPAPAPMPESSGEYHAYTLPGRVDLPDGVSQRAQLLEPARDVRCEKRYETRSPQGYYRSSTPIVDPDYGSRGAQPVQTRLAFTNDKAAGLGVPLPAGRLRVYERGENGDGLLGDASIGHTAAGRTVDVALGDAFDLSAERTSTEVKLADDRLSLRETVEVKLANAKPGTATVRVVETLPRWNDWDVTDSSVKWTRVDAQTIAFDVPVPAAGEATLRYSVRYRWPAAVKP